MEKSYSNSVPPSNNNKTNQQFIAYEPKKIQKKIR